MIESYLRANKMFVDYSEVNSNPFFFLYYYYYSFYCTSLSNMFIDIVFDSEFVAELSLRARECIRLVSN